eukprot:TRINITY_DN8042_c0_g1_i4.p1 TRINITY_DN8042_c0_g1~~TRINITY_DN8042_c0_g1_i4.p1  ORF type:complete len:941 (-),score=307.12 TRINITY_DN8042_c0_g1_i4:52-2874(-)
MKRFGLTLLFLWGLIGLVSASYRVVSLKNETYGVSAVLALDSPGPYGRDFTQLKFEAHYQTKQRLHVKIAPLTQVWEVPDSLLQITESSTQALSPDYQLTITNSPFRFTITRTADSSILFDTTSTLIFSPQYLELTTSFTTPRPYLYGLGERDASLRVQFDTPYVMFSKDQTATNNTLNTYGSHPFYLRMEEGKGTAHGVFLYNSNAMETYLSSRGSLTYRVTGGLFDFYFLMGPAPADVIQQYTEIVGRPYLPPLWSLGFHQCRWGYANINDTRDVVLNYERNQLPLDTIWNDIDYMYHYNDFSLDPYRFPADEVAKFDKWLDSRGQHHVYIVDPAVPVRDYPPYQEGLQKQAFIKSAETEAPVWSRVWPLQPVVFPDFTSPNTRSWWQDQIQYWFNQGALASGLWIDMNEPSAFCNGQYPTDCYHVYGPPYSENVTNSASEQRVLNQWTQFVQDEWARVQAMPKLPSPVVVPPPPYVPGGFLDEKTVNMSARQNLSLHYNVHSMYGYFELIATRQALENLRGKRALVISRSTFPGAGFHGGHWTGDNDATYASLQISIPHVLSMQLFGIPLVGADICGFNGNTTIDLCARWMQLGAFYPFSRNHNTWNTIAQEPYALGTTVWMASYQSLRLRYSLLFYYYSLFFAAHLKGEMVARPMWVEFPRDLHTYDIENQFFVGSALLVCPVLEPNQVSVRAYLPNADWYRLSDGFLQANYNASQGNQGSYMTLSAPLDGVAPFFLRGGSIIPTQTPGNTTANTRINPFEIVVALSSADGQAKGMLFYDDGESLDTVRSGKYIQSEFVVTTNSAGGQLVVQNLMAGYVPPSSATITSIKVYGIRSAAVPSAVLVINDTSASLPLVFNFDANTLRIKNLNQPITSSFRISWVYTAPQPAPASGLGWRWILIGVILAVLGVGLLYVAYKKLCRGDAEPSDGSYTRVD